MKRALKKKEKAVLENTLSEDAHMEPSLNPRVNRLMPTKVAMIGLAISMGATSLLVTRQSDGAIAAETVGNQNAASTIPTNDSELQLNQATPVVKPENAAIVEPTAVSQVPGLAAQWQVEANKEARMLSNKLTASKSTEVKELSHEDKTNVSQFKNNKNLGFTGNQSVLADSNPAQAGTVSNPINVQLKAQQEFALSSLQQKSNRLRATLAESRQKENQDELPKVTPMMPMTTVEKTSQIPQQSQPSTSRTKLVSRLKQRYLAQPAPLASATPVTSVDNATSTPIADATEETQAVTASSYGTVSELIKANSQGNPQLPSSQTQIPATATRVGTVTQMPLTSNSNVVTPSATVDINNTSTKTEHSSVSVSTPISTNTQFKPVTEPTAAANAPTLATTPEVSHGIGGDSPIPPALTQQLVAQQGATVKKTKLKNQRLRSLQAEIERLREKYRTQQSGSSSGNVVVSEGIQRNDEAINNSSVTIPVPSLNNQPVPISVPKPMYEYSKPSSRSRTNQNTEEPINPEYLPNRTTVTIPARNVDASQSLSTMRGTPVAPDLPPLAAVDRYLPRPIDETTASTGSYIWPAKGVLTSGYGWRWGRMHKGIDIAGPTGTPIYAAADGVVEKAGWNSGGYGNLVDIRHPDGSLTRYGHNSKVMVQVGQQVRQGETIAAMGSTGFSTGPHSHFEIHPSGQGAVNPIALLPQPRI
ncbi:peptidoglycan DD-metalloendopeptidase family protein [Iningainema tapete]|uniref:Peptidoglycan DD-metalloendopeptidase family protein n=1 Tax=Iningainema tapete BLCC-T55 TaxID=2748662 RepID=A0A8J6XA28_9CYAN|nr:peptidoglycan DD-metalloendopeptidase family protein [Iningainema tapete]MBD2770840.1 peptidoglycan DD-metalloendopeptidase family protein [Iningainema tapete BLCC-T55]